MAMLVFGLNLDLKIEIILLFEVLLTSDEVFLVNKKHLIQSEAEASMLNLNHSEKQKHVLKTTRETCLASLLNSHEVVQEKKPGENKTSINLRLKQPAWIFNRFIKI